MLPADSPLWVLGLSGLILVAIPFVWYMLVALVFSWHPVANRYHDLQRTIDRHCGGVFLYLGARFAASD